MEEIRVVGTVTEIIYQNPDNGYTVCEIENEGEGIFTATGYMPYLSVGESVALTGRWVEHPDYGEQFKTDSYETVLPTDESTILKYLSSGIVPGVGEATAKNLVAHFGNKTLDIMLNNPDRLVEIKGISPKRAEKISTAFLELQSMQGIVLYLQQFNIGASMAMRVQKALGRNAVERIKDNPYILSDMVDGIGFKTADEIAFYQGMPKNSPVRIRHGIRFLLLDAAYSGGHTYVIEDTLLEMAVKRLEVTKEEAAEGVSSLILSHNLYAEEYDNGRRLSLAVFYSAENYVARRLASMSLSLPQYMPERDEIEEIIAKTEETENITLAEEQKAAVVTAAESSCMVITGGPGTGKTTIIKTIIALMHSLAQEIALAAPTGRAAKRMSAVTGDEAKTIHRLLGMKPSEDEAKFTYDESNPLTADVVIVDEASMIDIQLANALLRAIKPGAKLILCGDADQLPSVGPGNVLRDIIASGAIKTISLKHIFRQAQESLIVMNAHSINRGEMPVLDCKDRDFFYLSRRSPDIITQTVTELYKVRLPRSYGIDAISKIQVLSPSKKGAAGTIAINKELQYAMNPPDMLKTEYRYGNTIFRVGDKVMQIKNDYDIIWTRENGEIGTGIFNGDMGIIESMSLKDKVMTVIFDDREVEYPFTNLDRLELAYAVTVHKSQGSEFPVVIIPIASFAPMLMYRNLLYTAVTRARDMVVIVGRSEEIGKMVMNNDQHIRYTGLCERLQAIRDMIEEEHLGKEN
ncbi:MAG: ATP-dependent RecD-like DNA helicase [Eubacteriales bacterium]|nr:ATP-dependent RecD-like DNA helicase [Eubacteriales bacterium]